MTVRSFSSLLTLAFVVSASAAGAQASVPTTRMDALHGATIAVSLPAVAPPTVAPPTVVTPTLAMPAGPRLDTERAGVGTLAVSATGARPMPRPQPALARKRGGPQMIIGGAALIGGAIVGGDAGALVMLGGLGVVLYGLYLYLQ